MGKILCGVKVEAIASIIPKIVIIVACGFLGEKSYTQQADQGTNASSSVSQPTNYSISSPTSTSSLAASKIDNAIDEQTYYIGGGDIFHIYLVDLPSMNYVGVVTQDYYLIIPALGIIPIGGKMTLARAKVVIADYMRQKLKKPNQIRVLLEGVKTAQITAFGSVNSPGNFSFTGSTRLWDALKLVSSANLSEINFREVRLKNTDSVAYFDLLAFLYKGNFSQNPYVYPGDQLYLLPATNRVFIGGSGLRAWINGLIPIHQNERIGDFLSFFFFNENADSEHIIVQRTEDGREYQQITYNLKQTEDFYLKNHDVIMVPVKNDYGSEFNIVNTTGEVLRPGSYPIPKTGTSVQTMIALAGGYTSFADSTRIVILRSDKVIPTYTITNVEGAVRPEVTAGLSMMVASKDYQVVRVKDHPESVLKNKDVLLIPRKENMVFVSGSVKYPGGYAFAPHQKKNYYIDLAGGMTPNADKSNVSIFSSFGNFVFQIKSSNEILDDGDIISVPMAREYKFFNMVLLPTVGLIVSAAGLIIGLASLLKL
jgi:protein involved in polysaccharide export with SLBB domain